MNLFLHFTEIYVFRHVMLFESIKTISNRLQQKTFKNTLLKEKLYSLRSIVNSKDTVRHGITESR